LVELGRAYSKLAAESHLAGGRLEQFSSVTGMLGGGALGQVAGKPIFSGLFALFEAQR
jgi:hypothetical protein